MELHQRLLLSVLLLAAAAAPAAEFAQLSRLADQGARTSALVWDLSTSGVIAALQPAQRLTPASLSKIVVASAALEAWAPDHTFATELRAARMPAGNVLEADLVLRGSGDATLDETTLWALAAQLRARGITRVRGKLLVERAPFGELACDTVDRCAALRRSARAYNAAPSAIGVNYGSWCIAVRASQTRAQAGGCATGELPIPLTGSVQVAPGGPALQVDRVTGSSGDAIAVRGSIAPGAERIVHRAMSDPAAGAGQILHSILRQTGIPVEGGVETAVRAPGNPEQVLARIEGLPLQEQVGRMMRWSNNYIADVLTMNLALASSGNPPASLADAARVLTLQIPAGTLAAANPSGPLVLESGSGLTTSNRLSAQDLVEVLKTRFHDARRFPAFYGSFVVPRDASFDYLKGGGDDWLDRVALKTGSLSEPFSVLGLAGYLRKKDGGWMAFAVIVNGGDRLRQIPRDRALAAARADLESLLARN